VLRDELVRLAAAVAGDWRRRSAREWVDGGAEDAYRVCLALAGGRPLRRPAYPAAYADMVVVLANDVATYGTDDEVRAALQVL
jgi:hypothetical protein